MSRTRSPIRRRAAAVGAGVAILTGSLLPLATAQADEVDDDRDVATAVVTIESLSTRADLVSDGNVLLEVDLPRGLDPSELTVTVGDRDVTAAFAPRAALDDRIVGLIEDLPLGEQTVTATVGDVGATLTLDNHPNGGPVFSGPHIEPWSCDDAAEDEDCNRPPTYTYKYKSTEGGGFQSYDPENPPDDVAETTTDEGVTVPFIIRVETGVLARDQYRIATLYQPGVEWTATEPQAQFNSKLVLTHGSSCDTSYAMGSAPNVELEDALSRGFIVASHALDHAGHNCNIVTQAESLVMTKERIVERYGELRYTIGSGCSGGGLAQQQVANAYPGVYQGITPACSFADAWSTASQYVDYVLMRNYFESEKFVDGGWTPTAMQSVYGHPNYANPVTFTEVIPNSGEPTRSCKGVASEDVYDEDTNPDGVRCTLQDYMVNVFGVRAEDGFAQRPYDNVGILYGLKGLLEGEILPQQFVDINTDIGGFDIDLTPQAERSPADPLALEMIYKSGANNTASNMDEVAIIDLRGPDPGAFHDVYRTYVMRQRLIREHGTAANQALWRGQAAILGDVTFADDAIVAMDGWLEAVEADTRDVPLAQKILDNRNVADRCTNGNGVDIPSTVCDVTVEAYSSPRIQAGMPFTDDVTKCQLKPLDRGEFVNVPFTDAQFAELEAAFPEGVCDYSKPGVSEDDTTPWMTYEDGPGLGRGMGEAPTSVPFGEIEETDCTEDDPCVVEVIEVAFGERATVTAAGSEPLPATGGGLALAGLGAIGSATVLRRRDR